MKRKLLILLVLILMIATGFVRESFFKNCNAFILLKSDGKLSPQLSEVWGFLYNYSIATLVKIKWVAILLFAIIYMAYTLILSKILFQNSFYKVITSTYSTIISISLIVMLIGILINSNEGVFYNFSRWLVGLTQSPLLSGVLILLLYYFEFKNKKLDSTLNGH